MSYTQIQTLSDFEATHDDAVARELEDLAAEDPAFSSQKKLGSRPKISHRHDDGTSAASDPLKLPTGLGDLIPYLRSAGARAAAIAALIKAGKDADSKFARRDPLPLVDAIVAAEGYQELNMPQDPARAQLRAMRRALEDAANTDTPSTRARARSPKANK